MKFISIAVKDFKELVRDRRGLFFILLFPIFFMMIFGFAFGGMGEGNTPHNIAIVNYDQGTINSTSGGNVNYGNNFITALQDANYENSSVKLLLGQERISKIVIYRSLFIRLNSLIG